jgi:16S rRNA (adenine1518-N6/adenine1519-N6)-dimethyltransferase
MKVWEIGPGLGAMTSGILERGADLTVFEIDRGFISLITQYFEDYTKKDRFHLVEGDVIKTWKSQLPNGIPSRLFGNLPYNIAATIIADTIEAEIRFDSCVFTVQKEVAQRMCAKPGTDDYSSFSVLCQWAYDLKPLIDLSGGNFWPKPNVDSRAVLLTKKAGWPCCKNPKAFVKLQRALFSSRRKNVRNNLSSYLKNNDMAMAYLEKAGIAPEKRAEVLSVPEILHLSDVIEGGL